MRVINMVGTLEAALPTVLRIFVSSIEGGLIWETSPSKEKKAGSKKSRWKRARKPVTVWFSWPNRSASASAYRGRSCMSR